MKKPTTELIDVSNVPKGTQYVQVEVELLATLMRELNRLRKFKFAAHSAMQDMVDTSRSIIGDSRAPYVGGVEDVVEFASQWAEEDDAIEVDLTTDVAWSPEDGDWIPEDWEIESSDIHDRLDEEVEVEQTAFDSKIKSPNEYLQDGSDGNAHMRKKNDLQSWNE